MAAGEGLSRVCTEELEALLRALYRRRFALPLTRQTLLLMGLNATADHGAAVIGLDAGGLQAVLVCVLAERRRAIARRSAGSPPSQ